MIVVLRNQLSATPANKRQIKNRIRAEASADAGLEAEVQRSGGSIYRQFHGLNAFAATVSKTERSALAKSSQVAQVVPDSVVSLPTPSGSVANPNAAGSAPQANQICPANPSKPLLEPEALQTTHTAYSDPTTPQAQNLATGAGVKVAFFADGVDPNNPDFIRPDGSHVFIDYKDFSGDGPFGPSDALEAFGDASSIAAQGRQVYDISKFVNPAHPLPAGCNITVRGIAPGASLIGIKVFGNAGNAFNSTILQGLDYALTVDHPDVFSESFGEYPIPDNTIDLTRQFNEQAVAAGATVVESTGDSGNVAGPSSASSDPEVIAAGASTTFQNYAQGTQYGYQFAHGWLSNNISALSSSGFTQAGRVLDLVAPGEANWALCSTNVAIYEGCVNYRNEPTNLESFGGTSESAPFIAGGAALVIQAYRQAHGGATPSAALVRQLMTSTATDLKAPSSEQGAGELNTLGAVQAAESVGKTGSAVGQNLLVGPTQLDLTGQAGSSFGTPVQVTNLSNSPQTISSHVRQITAQLADPSGSVNLLESSPHFVDQFGNSVPYEVIHFRVPAGTDRLLAYNSWPSTLSRIDMTLIDPDGRFAATTRAQGDGNHAQTDLAEPVAGEWTGIIFRRDGTFFGPVLWQVISQKFSNVDTVTPASLTLAPGQSEPITVSGTFPSSGGDSNQDLVVGSSVVPIALRTLVPLSSTGGSFSGNLIGGNGRGGAFQPGQIDTYEFDVPPGQQELTVGLSFAHDPGTEIFGSLIAPNGLTVTDGDNAFTHNNGDTTDTNGLQAYTPSPQAGRWRFVVDIINPVGGQVLSAPYHGRIGFAPPPIHITGLPNSASTVLPAGHAANVKVEITNNGVGHDSVFLDPRSTEQQTFGLLPLTQSTDLPLPFPLATQEPPLFLVPTETNAVAAFAQANEPVAFDFGFGDPDIEAKTTGDTAAGSFSGPATPGIWDIAPTAIGPFPEAAPPGHVGVGMDATTLGFDTTVASTTGDIELQAVDPTAAAFTPLSLNAGQTGVLSATITPNGPQGTTVKGTLYVDVYDNRIGISGEIVAVPYQYKIGPS